MNSSIDEITLLHQAQARVTAHHHMVVRGIGEEIDLEIGPGDDDPTFSSTTLVGVPTHESVAPEDQDDHKQILLASQVPTDDQSQLVKAPQGKRKKKVVKKWREEWADTYKWAYVDMHEGTARIFCSVCREYGRKHRRNPYGNEGSRNMQMSALEEHNNSLLHKEALRLQMASKDKVLHVDKPVYVKALMSKSASSILESVLRRDPHEVEFIQSVQEVVHSLEPVLLKNSQYVHILERLLEPDRVLIFRVPWVDDRGEVHVNRGFRVQFSQVLGPCRGGLRFHPSMNLSITKFLGFDQTLKNALSPYKLGGAGGGSDFDPKGKSESEIMRFCQSFMDELYKYLGPDQDLPAEDMGVGPREMGYLFGQYRRLSGHFQGSFTGPKIFWSGSSLRTEATGYGLVFFARLILAEMNKELKGLRCAVSGSGKIAMHVLEKLDSCGAIPITVSDSKGYLLDEDGFDYMKISLIRDIKLQQKSLREYLKSNPRAKYFEDAKPWSECCDIAFPCASQNEIDQPDAIALVNSGCRVLVEGSNMPCTPQAIDILRKAKVLVAPAKAASAGGVAVGELELSHECNLMQGSSEGFEAKLQVFEAKLQETMKYMYERSVKAAGEYNYLKDNPEALVHGGNICAFLDIAHAMIDQGCV
ncbi:NADP-specific glutamate dehydrogenase-like isoform X3 [Zingiber officinale]|uniref:NADP-specific glutamate dehydrogenase-like isoform X3 n=1 Tax=Zingiber officinale TaxID=94328 RepID=UPI001C4C65BE|nr:NADP-specific glutamate dehydrogenase-like isoform X3 [Zingiber officinale]